MIHARIDNSELNSQRRFACGIGPELPQGDTWFYQNETAAARHVDCPGCNPRGSAEIGTPISELSGRPGYEGYDEFCRIAKSWGYD
jgi:hypothetical protein